MGTRRLPANDLKLIDYLATLEQLGLVRVYRRDGPERGPLVQVDLRALLWRDEWRQRYPTRGAQD